MRLISADIELTPEILAAWSRPDCITFLPLDELRLMIIPLPLAIYPPRTRP